MNILYNDPSALSQLRIVQDELFAVLCNWVGVGWLSDEGQLLNYPH